MRKHGSSQYPSGQAPSILEASNGVSFTFEYVHAQLGNFYYEGQGTGGPTHDAAFGYEGYSSMSSTVSPTLPPNLDPLQKKRASTDNSIASYRGVCQSCNINTSTSLCTLCRRRICNSCVVTDLDICLDCAEQRRAMLDRPSGSSVAWRPYIGLSPHLEAQSVSFV